MMEGSGSVPIMTDPGCPKHTDPDPDPQHWLQNELKNRALKFLPNFLKISIKKVRNKCPRVNKIFISMT